ncbi:MAG TPA: FMN-binding negative transcriptional regulator [Bryobacteraceae bacterium]|nr:FMN-binding negative transcriptional regulator [Bryobacteraceae bacterium]
MYIPAHFREERTEILHQLIRRHPLATLVTLGRDGLIASHIPLFLEPEPAPLGTLRGHVARANPQWRDFRPDVDALGIFQGPGAYITPSWYPTRTETGRVVPTWNYIVVHATGPLKTFDDPSALERHVRQLTDWQEAGFPQPWSVDDAPPDFVRSMIEGIMGLEIPIARLEGKWKISQNRPAADQAGVIQGLRASADPGSHAMAGWIAGRQEP